MTDHDTNGEIIATGLEFPEGPVWRDGVLDFVEITAGKVSRWQPDGSVVDISSRRP